MEKTDPFDGEEGDRLAVGPEGEFAFYFLR